MKVDHSDAQVQEARVAAEVAVGCLDLICLAGQRFFAGKRADEIAVNSAENRTDSVFEVAVPDLLDKGLICIRVKVAHQYLEAVNFGFDQLVRQVSRLYHLIKGE
jgi:Tfp pilus assembly PilM family ATPase